MDGVVTVGVKDKMGCISPKGLRVFQITADGRYGISEDLFFKTHFPMNIKRQSQAISTYDITEEDLLNEILDIDRIGVQGENRVYFLFGATGSGKSELSKWLQVKLAETPRGSVVHRVSKTELDLPIIVQKFRSVLDEDEGKFSEEIRDKQKEIGRLPETTANLLLYQSIYGKLNDDDVKVLVSRLQPVLAEGIRHAFNPETRDKDKEEERGEHIHPLLKEDYIDNLKDTNLLEKVGYEELNKKILDNIQKLYLEDTNIVDTLERISNNITKNMGTRPVLLIDDIVQSMTFYVVSLLDYFMDFSRGHWDVVIGITPSSLELTQQGREILTKITQQNTVVERATTLFLTDKIGNESYVINNLNCVDFIEPYLVEYKRLNDCVCDSDCKYYENCIKLNASGSPEPRLAPFNSTLMRRIFNNLPLQEGKSRSFIVTIRKLLDNIEKTDDIIRAIKDESVVQKTFRATFPTDDRIESIAELYLPTSAGETLEVPQDLLSFFNVENIDDHVYVDIFSFVEEPTEDDVGEEIEVPDPVKAAIDDWLDYKGLGQDKIQLLLGLRQGTVSIIEEFMKPNELGNSNLPRLSGALRWQGRIQGTDPPINIEGIDQHDGIQLKREIQNLALLLHSYQTDILKRNDIRGKILNNGKLGPLLQSGINYRENCIKEISEHIGIELDRLIAYMYILSVSSNGPYEIIPPITLAKYNLDYIFNDTLSKLPAGLSKFDCKFSSFQREQIENMFNDFFLLRTNIYDGYRLQFLLKDKDIFKIIEEVLTVKTVNIPKQYKVGSRTLEDFIETIKSNIEKLNNLRNEEKAKEIFNDFERIYSIIDSIEINYTKELFTIFNNLYNDNLKNDEILKILKDINYSYVGNEVNLVDMKEVVKNIKEYYYDPLKKQKILSPTMFLRFLYEFRTLEDNEFIEWVINYDENLSSIEETVTNIIISTENEVVNNYQKLKENNFSVYDYLEEYKDLLSDFYNEEINLKEYEIIKEITLLDDKEKNLETYDVLSRSKHVKSMIEYILKLNKLNKVIKDYVENINPDEIRQLLSWAFLFKSLDSELNIEDQYNFWAAIVTDNIEINQDNIKTLSKLNDNIIKYSRSITHLQESRYLDLKTLISEKQKVWSTIEILKTDKRAKKIVDIFPITAGSCRVLIKSTASMDIYNSDEVYKVARSIIDFNLKIKGSGRQDDTLGILKRGLSEETYNLLLHIVRDRLSISLDEIKLENIVELRRKIPEILSLIGISLKL